jgi:hypothetical protein
LGSIKSVFFAGDYSTGVPTQKWRVGKDQILFLSTKAVISNVPIKRRAGGRLDKVFFKKLKLKILLTIKVSDMLAST